MNKTKIEWVKNPDGTQGYTLNPIKGKCPMACRDNSGKIYCFNHKRIDRFHLDPMPRFLPEVLDLAETEMIARKHSMGIFLCSTFEWLWNEEWALEIYQFCKAWEVCPDVRFYLLTKQPQNLINWSPFPENCWVGVTVTNYKQWCKAVLYLMNVEASLKFISFEPLLESIRFTENDNLRSAHYPFFTGGIKWVIIGAQTPYSKKTFPKWEWVKEIIEACDKAGIPIFLKDNLGLPKYNCEGGMPFYKRHSTGTMELRQEFPDA